MAKLSDLVNVNINRDTITIQNVEIPVIFSMKSFAFVEEAYGTPYLLFEKRMNSRLLSGKFNLGKEELKIMRALIYGMVRAGDTECTPEELEGSIPQSELPQIFEKVLNLYVNQRFQKSDMDKLKQEKK